MQNECPNTELSLLHLCLTFLNAGIIDQYHPSFKSEFLDGGIINI